MSTPPASKNQSELDRLHAILTPVLAEAAIGNFGEAPMVSREYSEQANDLIAGVGVLLEVIQEKIAELEQANARLAEAHDRTLSILDEVLTKSLERD